jgi:hypothetical protein
MYQASLLAFPLKKAPQTAHRMEYRRKIIVRNIMRSKLHAYHLPAKICRGRGKPEENKPI